MNTEQRAPYKLCSKLAADLSHRLSIEFGGGHREAQCVAAYYAAEELIADEFYAHGSATDEPNPNGSTHARLNWWKARNDDVNEQLGGCETKSERYRLLTIKQDAEIAEARNKCEELAARLNECEDPRITAEKDAELKRMKARAEAVELSLRSHEAGKVLLDFQVRRLQETISTLTAQLIDAREEVISLANAAMFDWDTMPQAARKKFHEVVIATCESVLATFSPSDAGNPKERA